MNFNLSAATAAAGLIQDCEDLLGMDANTIAGSVALKKTFTKNINEWYKQVNTWIWQSTGLWEYDDANYTDLPVATTTLVHNQQDYELPSVAQKIDRIELLDSNANYGLLLPIDKSSIKNLSMTEFQESAGFPLYYDLVGRSVLLYPKPSSASVTTTAGLKVYFTRNIDVLNATATTASPGFNVDFHRILSLGASCDYAVSYEMVDKLPYLKGQINEMKKDLKKFYGSRHRGMPPIFTPKRRHYT